MIVAVDLAIALFALVVGSYAAFKAYKIDSAEKTDATDQRYELEKDYYLVSTVGWMTIGARILAIPLFFVAVISLIPSIPGAMCEFGVLQAGSPYSWAAFGLKLFTIFAFGGWLFMDYVNRKMKGAPMMRNLARGFVLLAPLLVVDAVLDIAFFASLEPLVVPCCMVVYANPAESLFGIGCPFCFITYEYPLLWGVISAYVISFGFVVWSFMVKRSARTLSIQEESSPILSKALVASIALAIIGTILLAVQVFLGPGVL